MSDNVSVVSVESSCTSPDSPKGLRKSVNKKKSKGRPVFLWSVSDVSKWLRRHCPLYYGLYGNLFEEHEISGRALVHLNSRKLDQMGINNADHRSELMNQFLRLRLKHEQMELRNLDRGVSL
ncbi:protein aveugle-like [Saccoglossus kowalevskii]|uniref:Sterile alpha motif domain-containing protein 12-like n=1 Tax=Saccoglossus kowalevskii TaxID=10224 RepID=A0ABM0GR51_SACKO|nr:PREDICTED: sterile alpha motif domain-containing protein 12-like [Saccoglossus kowalevskii]